MRHHYRSMRHMWPNTSLLSFFIDVKCNFIFICRKILIYELISKHRPKNASLYLESLARPLSSFRKTWQNLHILYRILFINIFSSFFSSCFLLNFSPLYFFVILFGKIVSKLIYCNMQHIRACQI